MSPLALLPWLVLSSSLTEPPWEEILVPRSGPRPAPYDAIEWLPSLHDGIAEARATGRPLFVTLRCLPCDQCAGFDQAVLEGGPELDPLLAQFVTVRLTDARQLDLRIFPVEGFQDMDLSWWGWFLSPDLRVYGVFGGKDHLSDTTRISPQALVTTLGRVLEHHHDPRREGWEQAFELDGPAPDLRGEPLRPTELPGHDSWARQAEVIDCLHCHQVAEILRQPALDAGTFDKQLDLAIWPLPENVGLTIDRDDGLLVTTVAADSPADRAGLRPGDQLAVADGRRLFSQADLRAALHRGPRAAGQLELLYQRDGHLGRAALSVEPGWRATPLAWRTSVSQGNVGAHPGFAWAHPAPPADRRRAGIPPGVLAARPWFGKHPDRSPAWNAGLRPSDLIVAIDGQSPDVTGREFMAWFRLHHDPGDTVTLTLRDPRGRERELSYQLR